MAPKKKSFTPIGPSASSPPVPTQVGADIVTDEGGSGDPELPRPPADQNQTGDVNPGATGSKAGAVLAMAGAANSRNGAVPSKTPTPAHTPRPTQVVRDEWRRDVPRTRRSLEKSLVRRSRDAHGHHARQHAGGVEARSQGREVAPSNTVRSKSTTRSSHRSPPPTPAEALARAQLLLDFPPAADKLDEWRATIQSLLSFANGDSTHAAGEKTGGGVVGEKTGGGATTVHSPPRRQRSPACRVDACEDDSTASSDPRVRRDQRYVLRERKKEDARTTIERRREAHRQSDKRAGPTVDKYAPEEPGGLPYAVTCPAFTRELRQV